MGYELKYHKVSARYFGHWCQKFEIEIYTEINLYVIVTCIEINNFCQKF